MNDVPPSLRLLRPALNPSETDGQTPSATPTTSSTGDLPKRKDARVKVACEACQKRKSKCDGARPACSQCSKKRTECHYLGLQNESRNDVRKRERDALAEQVDGYQILLNVLRGGTYREAAEVLRRLRSTKDPVETIMLIKDSALLLPPGAGSPTGYGNDEDPLQPPLQRRRVTVSDRPYFPPMYSREESTNSVSTETPQDSYPPYTDVVAHPWTTVTDDDGFICHLVSLFLTWEQPSHSYVDAAGFLRDMRCTNGSVIPQAPDNLQFCSSLLVNAICARACQLSYDNRAFTIPNDLTSRGSVFAEEARRLFETERYRPAITTIQSAWIMFTYDSCLGASADARHTRKYVKTVAEMYSKLDLANLQNRPPDYAISERIRREWHSKSTVIWGFYAMDSFVALSQGWPPELNKPIIERNFQPSGILKYEHHSEVDSWFPYPDSQELRPSLRIETLNAQIELTDITHEIFSHVLPQEDEDLVEEVGLPGAFVIYRRLLAWKQKLPETLLLQHRDVAHAILLHIQYDATIVALFRPYQNLGVSQYEFRVPDPSRSFSMPTPQSSSFVYVPEDTPIQLCRSHSIAALKSLWQYRALYTLPRHMGVMFGLSTAVFTLMFHLPAHGFDIPSDAFTQVCQGIHDCVPSWPIAGAIMMGVRTLMSQFGIAMPPRTRRYLKEIQVVDLPPKFLNLPVVLPKVGKGGPVLLGAYQESLPDLFGNFMDIND